MVLNLAAHVLFLKAILEALIEIPWHKNQPLEAKRFDPYGRIYFVFNFSILVLLFHWTFCTRSQIENKSRHNQIPGNNEFHSTREVMVGKAGS